MTDQMMVASISGGVALLVALLGIAGAIAAQVVATRRTFANSLALFEEQALEARHAREEAARIENRHRFADQKRSTYGRALCLADDVAAACRDKRWAVDKYKRQLDALDRAVQSSETVAELAKKYATEADGHRDRANRLFASLAEVVGEIELLSSDAVCSTATHLRDLAYTTNKDQEDRYREARDKFLLSARSELGVEHT
ncbi:hypothetical protein GCM10010174_52560 [Kutzneria viridogrisea]|uniref:Uncharacterized protein n=1 Tax=Kutzneria viridogrisea TaxID=47990 RepID=A0ABR6BJT0_9PSEU|nr:hypothetical protein [Kutzneria viridogrisea]